jgi:Transposase, Mutator family
MTGIGPVAVRCRRMRDRVREGSERIRFSSAILPPYAPRSKSLEVLIPILYLKGISTGEFEEALAVLLGKDAGGQSASTVARLKDAWSEERVRWSKRDLWSSSAPRPRSRTYLAQRTSSKTHSQRSAITPCAPRGAQQDRARHEIYKLAEAAEKAGSAPTITISCRKLSLE